MARSPFSSSSTNGTSSCPSLASQSGSRLLGVDASGTIVYGFFIGGLSSDEHPTDTTAGQESPPTFHYAWDSLDGRLPALTARGETLRQVGSAFEDLPMTRPVRVRTVGAGVDHPEDRGLSERCLVGFNAGPPMIQGGYNNYMQVFQTPDTVVIFNEMVHDARIIPLDQRPRVSDRIQQWAGQSRGHWDGDTLVVVTTNFSDLRASYEPSSRVAIGTGSTMTLTERFRRLDEETLLYEYTVYDPTIFTQPFTVSLPMRRNDQPLFEYACHEGNHGLLNILLGARTDELN